MGLARTQDNKYKEGRKEVLPIYLCEFWLQFNGFPILDYLQL